MGLRNALRLTRTAPELATVPGTVATIGSPWSDTSQLESIVWADLLDVDLLPMTRAEAMTVPAVSRSRHLLAGAVAGCPLRVLVGDVQLTPEHTPTWTYRTDGPVPPHQRMLGTADDLLFTGWSLWAVDRGADGFVLAADRVPRELWQITADGTIEVNGSTVPPDAVIAIQGPHEGLLTFGARTIRAASKLERAAARHASNPVPSIELHQEVDTQITDRERDDVISQWAAARVSDTGAVGFTSYGIRAYPLGAVPEQLLINGRNAAAVDVARHVSIPAAMLDATTAGASLTYETTQGRNGQFVDYGVQ